MENLEFVTTKELIKELLSRETFAGILIYVDKDIKTIAEPLEDWNMAVSRVAPEDAKFLLNYISESMEIEENS